MRRPYAWRCLACNATNAPELCRCVICDCPSHATLRDIEDHRPKPSSEELEQLKRRAKKIQNEHREALLHSHFRKFYFASVGFYAISLMAPDGSGLVMLLAGPVANTAGVSAAWLANPLLLSAFLLIKSDNNPWRWRWLVYGAFAMTLTTPVHLLLDMPILNLFFCSLWALSPLVLCIGMHRYRSSLRGLLLGA